MTATSADSAKPLRVIVAGGGVAGLEAVMALKRSAGDRVAIMLVAPNDEFVYRPLSVGEPFALGAPQRVSLEKFAEEHDVYFRRDTIATVFPDTHAVALGDGSDVVYDELIVAVGARRVPAYEHATSFRGQEDVEAMHGLVKDVEMGYVHRIAFVVPAGISWSLPLYELALMTARRAFEMDVEVELTFITPEERPLPVFGAQASADVAALLDQAGISVRCSVVADVPSKGTVVLRGGDETIEVDRVIALAAIEAIPVKGLPADPAGYLQVDSQCRVGGLDHVYAAGDGTNFPLKQGGLACQQADVAAENIARAAGVPLQPAIFRPVLRGQLLTGQKPQFMHHDVSGRAGDRSESSEHMLWWPPMKVAGRYLAPYLAMQGDALDALDAGEVALRGYEFATR
jgi:sulfide:quinone oxidoreductase